MSATTVTERKWDCGNGIDDGPWNPQAALFFGAVIAASLAESFDGEQRGAFDQAAAALGDAALGQG